MRRIILVLSPLLLLAACVHNPCSETAYLRARTVPAAPILQHDFFKLPMNRSYAIPDLPPGSPALTRKNSCMIVPPVVTPRPEKVGTASTGKTQGA